MSEASVMRENGFRILTLEWQTDISSRSFSPVRAYTSRVPESAVPDFNCKHYTILKRA